jgi:hypothetical protein
MTDMSIPSAIAEAARAEKPAYLRPSLKVMNQDEVLEAFQMTATEISAAGCWWNGC